MRSQTHFRLAQSLEQQGELRDTVAHYREALAKTHDFPEATAALDAILLAHPKLK